MALLTITIFFFYLLSILFRSSMAIIRNLIRALEGAGWLAPVAILAGIFQKPKLTARALSNIFDFIEWVAEELLEIIVDMMNT